MKSERTPKMLKMLIRDERGLMPLWLALILLGAAAAALISQAGNRPPVKVDSDGIPVNVQPVMATPAPTPAPQAPSDSGGQVQGQVPSGGSSIDTTNQTPDTPAPVVVVTGGSGGTDNGSNTTNGGSSSSSSSSSSSNGCQSMGGYYLASGDMGGGSNCSSGSGGTTGGGGSSG